jgi:uncharacterized protein (TIGR00266 family)
VEIDIRYQPSFAAIFVTLAPGESITAESGAMVGMDGKLTMKTELNGGLCSAILKKFFGGESFFVNQFQNTTGQPQQVVLTQSTIGDIASIDLQGNSICFQPGAYIASTPGVNLGVKWAGLASWFSGEGLFKLQASGRGTIFFGAYGGLTRQQVNGEFIVDTGHLVAYEPTLKMSVKMAGGLLGAVTSGEGFVNKITGTGAIYLQSRSLGGLVRFLAPKV